MSAKARITATQGRVTPHQAPPQTAPVKQIVFTGEKFDADSVRRYRDKLLAGS